LLMGKVGGSVGLGWGLLWMLLLVSVDVLSKCRTGTLWV
jgi:hypothetical protein